MPEKRTFVVVDDASENYYVARFTRTKDQVKAHIWELPIGALLPIKDACGKVTTRQYSRER